MAVLFVCTANQCRSPMAEALLRMRLAPGSDVGVESAGFLEPGSPCTQPVLEVMAEVGADLSGHRSRRVSAELIDASTLVVTMTRQHLVDLAVEFPGDWGRFFTIHDLVRRASRTGPRSAGEPLETWAERLGAGRQRSDLLQVPSNGDIPDPIGKPVRAYRGVRDRLAALADEIAAAVGSPSPGRPTAGP